MLTYFYKCLPLVIVAAVVILSLPWLGLIALMIVALPALAALAALAWEIVAVPYRLGQVVTRHWHDRSGASPRMAPLSLARHQRPSPRDGSGLLAFDQARYRQD
jgi:hypothetical protein